MNLLKNRINWKQAEQRAAESQKLRRDMDALTNQIRDKDARMRELERWSTVAIVIFIFLTKIPDKINSKKDSIGLLFFWLNCRIPLHSEALPQNIVATWIHSELNDLPPPF